MYASSIPNALGLRPPAPAPHRAVALATLLSLSVSFIAAGCAAPTRRWQPTISAEALDDMRFVHYLAGVPVVTVDEGMRAVLLLTNPNERFSSFDERRAALRRHGAVKDAWQLAEDQILTQGTLAFMLRSTGKTPQSLNEWLSGLTGLGDRRYALRTCIDEGILPYSRAADPVSGGELLSALERVERSEPRNGDDGS